MKSILLRAIAGLIIAGGVAAPQTGTAAMMRPPHAIQLTQSAGAYRVVLVMLPAEPYVTAADVRRRHLTEGMLAVRGATPVQPNDPARPNHHLVVHIYRAATGRPLTGAHIAMSYVGPAPAKTRTRVPIVEMQAVGGGALSTHYGNNVRLKPGRYSVYVTVNGTTTATFAIRSM